MFKNLSKFKKATLIILSMISFVSILWLLTLKKDTVIPIVVKPTNTPIEYKFIKSIPTSGSVSNLPVTSNIDFYFSKPVEESTADVTITPNTFLEFSSDPTTNSFHIRAVPNWKISQEYNLKIKIKSRDGEVLKNEIDYTFKLEKMKDSPLTE